MGRPVRRLSWVARAGTVSESRHSDALRDRVARQYHLTSLCLSTYKHGVNRFLVLSCFFVMHVLSGTD